MGGNTLKKTLILFILVNFSPFFPAAEDLRTVPLEMYLIIDASSAFREQKNDALSWVNGEAIDRVLMEGDVITVWAAGDRAEIIYSGDSGDKETIKNRLLNMETGGETADFTGALREVSARLSQTGNSPSRLSVTMLVTSSAAGLQPALAGGSQGLLRWSRSLRYEGWQVLIVGPGMGPRVREAAEAYMNSRR